MTDNTQNTHPLSDLFALVPAKENKVVTFNSSDKVNNLVEIKNEDTKYVRDNIVNLIEIGQEALTTLSGIANQSQQPRAYEVVSSLLKTLLDANKDLLDIHVKNTELNKKESDSPNKVINNNLIVGSTNDIAKLLSQKPKGDE